MTMIEKIARAIASSRYGIKPDLPSSSYFADNGKLRNLTMWEQAMPDARAVLEAMLEPSEGIFEKMMQSYADSIKLSNGECISPDAYWLRLDGFSGMIRAALEEK